MAVPSVAFLIFFTTSSVLNGKDGHSGSYSAKDSDRFERRSGGENGREFQTGRKFLEE